MHRRISTASGSERGPHKKLFTGATRTTAQRTYSALVNRLSRFGPAICLLLVLALLATASAFAHDPGLSAAEVRLDGNKAVARLTFARDDIEMVAPMDADRDGRVTQP